MTMADFADIAGTVLAALAVWLANQAIAAFQKRTNIQLTDQQRAAVLGAVQTAAGEINLELSKGLMSLSDVHADNPTVKALATAAVNTVPDSAAALGVASADAAKMVVGKVGNALPSGTTIAAPIGPMTAYGLTPNPVPLAPVAQAPKA